MTHDEWRVRLTQVQARRYTSWLQRSEPVERPMLQGSRPDFVVLDDLDPGEADVPVRISVLALVVLIILLGLASFWVGVGLAIVIHGLRF